MLFIFTEMSLWFFFWGAQLLGVVFHTGSYNNIWEAREIKI